MRICAYVLCGLALAITAAQAADAPDPMTAPPPPGYYVMQHVVYQNDGRPGDEHAYFTLLLANLHNHIAAVDGKVDIQVVNFAAGLHLLTMAKTDAELAKSLDDLRAKGVKFKICRNTMRAMNLRPDDLYNVTWDDVVPSGVAEVARLQGLGYVFEHP